MSSIDPHSVYHFGYPLFLSLPDLTTKVNSFDDLNKNRRFVLYLLPMNWICDKLNQLRKQF